MAKKKKEDETLMGAAKETIGLGIVSGAGLGALGAMSAIPGMPAAASGVTQVAGAGLTLTNVGRLAKTGMTVANTLTPSTAPTKPTTKKKSKSDDVVSKILGY